MAYSYTPLSSSYIRLFVLEPHANDSRSDFHMNSRICGRLISVKFSMVEYQALSYCWGDDGKKKDIWVGDKVMQVGENLWSALDHLQRSSFAYGGQSPNHWSSRCLWIDAICINQVDIQERNREVSRMSEVYRRAQRVIIWLGLANSTSELAVTTLNSIDKISKREYELDNSPLGSEARVGEALVEFVNRPYFSRMWIVQEIILARQIIIYCGARSVLWSKLSILLDCIKDPVLYTNIKWDTAKKINVSLAMDLHQNRKKWQERKTNLEELLRCYSLNLCRDPRDKVYSLLGIAADCQSGKLKADYNKDLGTVYQDVIRLWTDHKTPENKVSMRIVELSELLHISFGPVFEIQSEVSRGSQLVPVAGCWRGTISRLGPQFREVDVDGIILTSNLVVSVSLSRFDISRSTYQPLDRRIKSLDELWSLLGRPSQGIEHASFAIINYRKPSEHIGLKSSLSNVSRRWKSIATKAFDPSVPSETPPGSMYFFELSTGYFGISPVPTQHDDIICTFMKTTVAVLLRKSTVANRYDLMARVILFARPPDQSHQIGDDRRDWLELISKFTLHEERDSYLIGRRQAEIELWLEIATLKRFTSCPY